MESIPWVRCASGNVFYVIQYSFAPFGFEFCISAPDVDNLSFAEAKLLPLTTIRWFLMGAAKDFNGHCKRTSN